MERGAPFFRQPSKSPSICAIMTMSAPGAFHDQIPRESNKLYDEALHHDADFAGRRRRITSTEQPAQRGTQTLLRWIEKQHHPLGRENVRGRLQLYTRRQYSPL